ncbi:MAG: hypothetical protein R2940_07170 [Syntrophotaleaceae bacterium]
MGAASAAKVLVRPCKPPFAANAAPTKTFHGLSCLVGAALAANRISRAELSGENLCLKLSLRGDLPYERVHVYEDKVYLGHMADGFETAFSQNNLVSGVLALTLVPIGVVVDIFGPKKEKREETIDDVVKTDCPIPIEDGTRVEGRLKISDIETGMVFEERAVSFQVKDSEVELPLPRLNNGGRLKIELNGAMEIYDSQVPVEYVGKVEI